MGRGARVALIACATLAALAYIERERLLFAVATGASAKRPDLLADAKWNHPDSAAAFRRRFHPGVTERELIDWLGKNRFVLDSGRRAATRRIQSLPCNERITIVWSADSSGKLTTADASVGEAGCL